MNSVLKRLAKRYNISRMTILKHGLFKDTEKYRYETYGADVNDIAADYVKKVKERLGAYVVVRHDNKYQLAVDLLELNKVDPGVFFAPDVDVFIELQMALPVPSQIISPKHDPLCAYMTWYCYKEGRPLEDSGAMVVYLYKKEDDLFETLPE